MIRFDLVEITKTIHARRRFILIFTIAAAVLGTIGYLLQRKMYKARAEFFVFNPLTADRNYIFRASNPLYIDYFATEDDIDRVMAAAKSDNVRNTVINNTNLYKEYGLNPEDEKDQEKMGSIYLKNYNVKRSEFKNLEVSFTDPNPKRAADVTNEVVRVIEESYRSYYNTIKNKIYGSLQAKVHETDSAIANLTDTLVRMRDHYHIYDIVSPARQNVITGNLHATGGDFGKGLEEIQNVESVKDQLVTDRAKYISALNEFSTGTKLNELRFVEVISNATPPLKPAGLGLPLTILVCAMAGLFLSIIIALFSTYYKALISVER